MLSKRNLLLLVLPLFEEASNVPHDALEERVGLVESLGMFIVDWDGVKRPGYVLLFMSRIQS